MVIMILNGYVQLEDNSGFIYPAKRFDNLSLTAKEELAKITNAVHFCTGGGYRPSFTGHFERYSYSYQKVDDAIVETNDCGYFLWVALTSK